MSWKNSWKYQKDDSWTVELQKSLFFKLCQKLIFHTLFGPGFLDFYAQNSQGQQVHEYIRMRVTGNTRSVELPKATVGHFTLQQKLRYAMSVCEALENVNTVRSLGAGRRQHPHTVDCGTWVVNTRRASSVTPTHSPSSNQTSSAEVQDFWSSGLASNYSAVGTNGVVAPIFKSKKFRRLWSDNGGISFSASPVKSAVVTAWTLDRKINLLFNLLRLLEVAMKFAQTVQFVGLETMYGLWYPVPCWGPLRKNGFVSLVRATGGKLFPVWDDISLNTGFDHSLYG